MGISALMAYRGDLCFATAAEKASIPMVMSGSSLIRLEEVAAVAPQSWFQAYLPGEPNKIDALVDRVAAAGFQTLLLTVDTATLANRENNIRTGFTPLRPSARLAWHGISHQHGVSAHSPERYFFMAYHILRTRTRPAEHLSFQRMSCATLENATTSIGTTFSEYAIVGTEG